MITFKDAGVLAITKLRTRKLRLSITIIISGLLFCVLATASFTFRGALKSLDSFSAEGLGSRYLTSANVQTPDEVIGNKDLAARAESIQKQLIAKKKAEAKRLGLEYDPLSEPPAVEEFDGPDGKQKNVIAGSPAGKQAIAEYRVKNPSPGDKELRSLAADYSATGFFRIKPIRSETQDAGNNTAPSLQVLQEGKEQYKLPASDQGQFGARGLGSFVSSWNLASKDLLGSFMLKGSSLAVEKDDRLPVLAPYTAAEELLGLKALPKTADSSEKIDRIKLVRQEIQNRNFDVCYRNGVSANLVQNAVAQQQEIDKNKNDKYYQKPNLTYSLPSKACGDVAIAKDTRSYEEKQLAKKQSEFDKIFGAQDPKSQILRFRVVGLAPDPPDPSAVGADQLIISVLGSSIGSGWFSPLEVEQNNKVVSSLFAGNSGQFGAPDNYITEFANAEQAKKFIDGANCQQDFTSEADMNEFYKQCTKDGKYFFISSFGSSSLALNDIKQFFGKYFRTVAIIFSVIAAIIMMGTVGRIIADSRRETAVFRAIGAKRKDIAQIYLGYVMLLSGLISGFALISGIIIALIANAQWTKGLSVAAILTYNSQDLNKKFTLFAIEPRDVLIIVGFVVLAGLASAILPLLSNLRRNPIKDMRDEN